MSLHEWSQRQRPQSLKLTSVTLNTARRHNQAWRFFIRKHLQTRRAAAANKSDLPCHRSHFVQTWRSTTFTWWNKHDWRLSRSRSHTSRVCQNAICYFCIRKPLSSVFISRLQPDTAAICHSWAQPCVATHNHSCKNPVADIAVRQIQLQLRQDAATASSRCSRTARAA